MMILSEKIESMEIEIANVLDGFHIQDDMTLLSKRSVRG